MKKILDISEKNRNYYFSYLKLIFSLSFNTLLSLSPLSTPYLILITLSNSEL